MFVKDIITEFHNVIRKKSEQHVLVISNCDVDAVCACKILQFLFRWDHLSYTLVPVSGVNELKKAVYDYLDQVKIVLLINCGANLNLIELLPEASDKTFFVIDSRRPIHLDNIFDARQVKLIVQPNETDDFKHPKFDEIYEDECSSSEEPDESLLSSSNPKRSKRKRLNRGDKTNWIQNRDRILFDYYENSFYSTSSALIVYTLAWKLSKDCNELLWAAAIGLTSQLVDGKINQSKYKFDSIEIQQQILKHNHDNKSRTGDVLRLRYESDLALVLYRHWSLLESLKHTLCTMCSFKTWTLNGVKKLEHFLVVLGIPLTQAQQKFRSLSNKAKKEIKDAIEQNVEKFKLSELLMSSIYADYTVVDKFSAKDVCCAVSALLHFRGENGGSVEENFLSALDSLSKNHSSLLYEGIEIYKKFMQILVGEVHAFLTTGLVIPSSVFLQCVLTRGCTGWKYFVNSYGLVTLGNYVCRTFVEKPRGEKHKKKSLIIVVPKLSDDGWVIVAGIPPFFFQINGSKPINILGQAFCRISERTTCRIEQSFFDASVVELNSEDRHKFCESLLSLIE